MEKCPECQEKFEVFELKKCPTCHKKVCEECSHVVGGIHFCSKHCSEFFFFGDGTGEE